jgi:hypothetical protein
LDRQEQGSKPQLHPLEAVAAWLLPGAGHLLLGQRARGLIIMVTIGALWLGGLLIGGLGVIDHWTVDRPGQSVELSFSWWFAGQALIGPSLGVDLLNQKISRRDWPPRFYPSPGRATIYPSLAHINEQGTLYTALAGMLNLLAILDVAYCDARQRRAGRREAPGNAVAVALDGGNA